MRWKAGPIIALCLILGTGQAFAAATLSVIATGSSNASALGIGTPDVSGLTSGDSVSFDVLIQSDEVIPGIFISVQSLGNIFTANPSELFVFVPPGMALVPVGSLPASGTDTSADINEQTTNVVPLAFFVSATKIGSVTITVNASSQVNTGVFNAGNVVFDSTFTDIAGSRVTFLGGTVSVPEPSLTLGGLAALVSLAAIRRRRGI